MNYLFIYQYFNMSILIAVYHQMSLPFFLSDGGEHQGMHHYT